MPNEYKSKSIPNNSDSEYDNRHAINPKNNPKNKKINLLLMTKKYNELNTRINPILTKYP